MTASTGRLVLWKGPKIGIVLDPGDGRRLYQPTADQVLDEVEAWLGRNWPRDPQKAPTRVYPGARGKKRHV